MQKFYRIVWIAGMIALCLMNNRAWSQSLTITGQVKSSDDDLGLPGVNVLEKGTTNGTVTNAEGNYTIQVTDKSAVLIFSFVGYATQEVAANGNVNITLSPDVATLEEVVVIGYDEVKKSDATGSVALIGSKSFNKGVVNSAQELISGKAAGVVVTSNSGAPGVASTIRIRGGASLNASNDPLIVIDGVPVTNTNLGGSANILSILNPNDIASVSVLKDASAAAIYGLRSSNGVIIITTKRGGQDFKITYSATGTLYTTPRKVDVLSGDEFRDLVNQQYGDIPAVTALLGDANTDWQDEIFDNAFGQDHNINLSGSVLKAPYRVAVGYNNTDGVLKTYNFERSSLTASIDPSLLNNSLKLNVNFKGMLNDNNFADQGAIGDAVVYDPTKPVFNGNTRWRGYTSWTLGGIDGNSINLAPANPVAKLDLTNNTSTVKRSIGSLKADYQLPFLKDLHTILNVAYDYTDTEGRNNVLDSTQWIYLPTVAGGIKRPYHSSSRNQLLDFYLNYNKELKNMNSKLELLGGYSWSEFYNKGGDFAMNESQEDTTRVNEYETRYVLLSFFGRANYTFKNKYMLAYTQRYDATSKFANSHRWGLFPSVALAWKINEENFLKTSKVVSELKLRLGYGVTGQQDIIGGTGGDYPSIATYTRSDVASRYQLGNTFYHTLRPDAYDVNIRWEETSTLNAGLDFGLFQNIISGSIDVYKKVSDDLIATIPIPVGTNFTSFLTTNIGRMENKGIEFGINAEIFSRENLQWVLGYNVAYVENKIAKLNLSGDPNYFVTTGGVGGTTAGTIQVHKVGSPAYAFFPYQQVYDQDGNPLEDVYVDRNNDGRINTSDLYVYKQPAPLVTMGINSRMNYKNFDFSFNGRVSIGNYLYNNIAANSTYRVYNSMEYLTNVPKFAHDTKFVVGANTRFSDYYIENASFFKMDNINLGYTFREVVQNKLNIRVGAGLMNAFVITKYTGIDPEVQSGLDNNLFPRTRSYFLNVNFEF
jgi:TonB-dependent starch-binding outer membrane protein SusC